MDYTERIDRMIDDFNNESRGVLARIISANEELENIEGQMSSLKKEIESYSKRLAASIDKTEKAGSVYHEIKTAISAVHSEIQTLNRAQKLAGDAISINAKELGKRSEEITLSLSRCASLSEKSLTHAIASEHKALENQKAATEQLTALFEQQIQTQKCLHELSISESSILDRFADISEKLDSILQGQQLLTSAVLDLQTKQSTVINQLNSIDNKVSSQSVQQQNSFDQVLTKINVIIEDLAKKRGLFLK